MPLVTPALRRLSAGTGSDTIVDASCGQCLACDGGMSLWCREPDDLRARRYADVPSEYGDTILRSLETAVALAHVPENSEDSSPILVMGDSAEVVAAFARKVVQRDIVTVHGNPDAALRQRLASHHASGRARVGASADSLRMAVRAVRRGGYACGATSAGPFASVTEVVQREVSLVPARDVRRFGDAFTVADWTDAITAASRVHAAS